MSVPCILFLCRKYRMLKGTDLCLLPCIRDTVDVGHSDCRMVIRACIGLEYPYSQNGEQERTPADRIKKASSTIRNDLHD